MHRSKNYGAKPRAKGLLRDHSKHRRLLACAPLASQVFPELPGEYDLRKRVSPPGFQGSCGSCWALAMTEALRSQKMLQGKDPGPLSPNYLLLNQGPIAGDACRGGDFDAGQNMIAGRGPCLASFSPYAGTVWGLTYPTNAPVAASAGKWVLVGDGCRKPTPQELCAALWNKGQGAVICTDVAADATLDNYRDGVIVRTSSLLVNHMVRLVGYCSGASVDSRGVALFNNEGGWIDPRGTYFILRNTWDLDWGIEGDCYIAYGVNNLAETAMLFQD